MTEATYRRPADGTEIVRAANAWRIADLEFQAADNAMVQHRGNAEMWQRYEDAQEALNEARRVLAALCDTRIRPYDANPS